MNSHSHTAPEPVTQQLSLEPNDSRRLANLCGLLGQHLRQIEQRFAIAIHNRGNEFALVGSAEATQTAAELLRHLYSETQSTELTPDEIHLALQTSGVEALMEQLNTPVAAADAAAGSEESSSGVTLIRTKKCTIKPRGLNQQRGLAPRAPDA